jgi:hypothetical protein
MAYVSPEYVKQTQLKHHLVYWKITDRTKKTVIDRNNATSLNASIDELQNALNITGDYVVVFLYSEEPEKTTAGSTRGKILELTVKLNDPFVNKGSGIGGLNLDYIVAAEKEKAAMMLEIEKLKMQQNEVKPNTIKEIIVSNPEILQGIVHFGKIAGGKLIDMIGSKNITTGINAPEINSELTEVLNKFKSIDPEYLSVLKRLSNMITGEPVMYWQFKQNLGFVVPEEKLK